MKVKLFQSKKVKDQWNHIWDIDDIERNHAKLDYPEYEKVFKLIQKNHKILEAGVGLGKFLNYFHQKGYDITGIDYSETAIQKLKEYNSEYKVSLGDIRNIPFPDESFNVYLSFGVIEHIESIEDVKKSISEIYRVLKKDGIAVITIPYLNFHNLLFVLNNNKNFSILYRLLKKKLPLRVPNSFFEYYYTTDEFLSYFDLDNQFKLEMLAPENIPLILKRFKKYRLKNIEHIYNTNLNEKGLNKWSELLKLPDNSFMRKQHSHLMMYVLRKK